MRTKKYMIILCSVFILILFSSGHAQEKVRRSERRIVETPSSQAPAIRVRKSEQRPIEDSSSHKAIRVLLSEPKPIEGYPKQSFAIKSGKEVYELDEDISIEVIVTNIYEENMDLYGNFKLGITSEKERKNYGANMEIDEENRIRELFWIDRILEPNKSINRKIDITSFTELPEGKYIITFSFRPWEYEENIPMNKFIVAKPLKIEIQ